MRMWQQWVNVVLGLIIAVAPFLGLAAATLTWVLVLAGIGVAIMGLWGSQETAAEREQGRMVHRPQH